jgi:NAD(P)-dependent dehydrogenase (short-subunit alcohol dehydrogenase family)
MPKINVIHQGVATLPKGPPLVVAIAGGTTGIGSYVARALADTFAKDGAKLRVYIIGRQASRANSHMKYGRETSPGSDWRFIAATDMSLMSDVDRVSQEIIKQEKSAPFAGGPPRLDVLYMSQALSPLQPSPSTYHIHCLQTKYYIPYSSISPQPPRKVSTANSPCFTTPASGSSTP